ncbi:TetR/AcrR family transcriptional regulator [Kitasatospora sp. NPDC048540]|uniref:TetR/AcrR family transcriptional regulator n=1 Tax=unclassified Kitasatospora TaxID=2633591 RepID=UPI0005399F46|nr:TetR/AcrR family transcriptional regulator [Kitasatospora sp. MBT63]
MEHPGWQPRRTAAVGPDLPAGVTPPGTRGRILEEALGLFAEAGFAGTSIRQIAAAVGINSATLYAHYPSKEHVLAHLVQVGHEELHARLAEAVASTRTADPATRVVALVRAHADVHTRFPLLAIVTDGEIHSLSPDLAAPALELRHACWQFLLDAIEQGIAEGVFHVPEPLLAATAISAMGVRVAHWAGPDQPFTPERIAEAHGEFALRILGATPSTAATAG